MIQSVKLKKYFMTFMRQLSTQYLKMLRNYCNVLGTDCGYIFKTRPFLLDVYSEMFMVDTMSGISDIKKIQGVEER